jgi:hypothetical protein
VGGALGMRWLPTAILLMLTVAALDGCAGHAAADTSRAPDLSAPSAAPVTTRPTGLPVESSKLAAARAAVLAAYRGYVTYSTLSAQTADFDSPRLREYAIDPVLGHWVISVNAMYQQGLVQRGAVVATHPVVTGVALSTRDGVPQGTATINDCLDNRGITFIDAVKRTVVADEHAHPFLSSVAHAEMFPDGHWVIARVETKDVASC